MNIFNFNGGGYKTFALALLLASAFVIAGCEEEQAASFELEGGGEEGGSEKVFNPEEDGYYWFQLWGSQGGSVSMPKSDDPDTILTGEGGKGAYVSALLYLEAGKALKISIGGNSDSAIGGGGSYEGSDGSSQANEYSSAGGGSTDLRFDVNGDGTYSLEERILVAAGGGGGSEGRNVATDIIIDGVYEGGYGGAQTGGNGNGWASATGKGGTQTAGGANGEPNAGEPGRFGKGGTYIGLTESVGGGGGGYYGGGSGGYRNNNGSGGGGSSYIAGQPGYDAFKGGSLPDGFIVRDNTEYKTEVIAGNATMPAPQGGSELGHSGTGYYKITKVAASF